MIYFSGNFKLVSILYWISNRAEKWLNISTNRIYVKNFFFEFNCGLTIFYGFLLYLHSKDGIEQLLYYSLLIQDDMSVKLSHVIKLSINKSVKKIQTFKISIF